MARLAVWLAGLGSGQGSARRDLAEELAGRGLECRPLKNPREPEAGPTLLLFDAFGAELLDCVSALSRGGQERLLAVGTHGGALARGDGWQLLAAGASDVLLWPETPDPAARIASRFARWNEVDALVDSPIVTRHLAGRGRTWRSLLRQIIEVARFSASPVLLLGESGTGKELVSRLIHSLDPRADKRDLVVLDCTTIVPSLAGSEFFGHERGAFTGALAARDGAVAVANGGTLFLDEIGELPTQLQAELLRVVQEGTYKRVGSNVWQSTRFRLVSATHRDLQEEISEGRFRHDFYYRIAAWSCRLPPLRERREDIPLLVERFLAERYQGEKGKKGSRRRLPRPSSIFSSAATTPATCASCASSSTASPTATSAAARSRSATCPRRSGRGALPTPPALPAFPACPPGSTALRTPCAWPSPAAWG